MGALATRKTTLLLVDDEPMNLRLLSQILGNGYRLLVAKDGPRALEIAQNDIPDLILLDVMMPGMTGHEVCTELKRLPALRHVPVIFVTALSEETDEMRGFELGAVDYITKPYGAAIVKARVRTHLSLVRADELLATRQQIVQCLGTAAEYKDNETGLHVVRMSHYARLLAKAVGFDDTALEDIFSAAPMHDIGKIGIPDAILKKPGKLDAEELSVMRNHPEIGARIIGEHRGGMLAMAHRIALCHHEKWDGTGYPRGLRGVAIPLEARIVAIADVFDALTSVRPYKKAWTVDDAVALLNNECGKHFDPELVKTFIGLLPEVRHVMQEFAEPSP